MNTSADLQTLSNELQRKDREFFDEAFTHPVTREPYQIPAHLRKASERICRAYGINGICDPMYIANVFAFELGLGDGQSNFHPSIAEKMLQAQQHAVKLLEKAMEK